MKIWGPTDLIIESSDWHEEPDFLSDEAKNLIGLAKEEGATLIGCGDIANLVPLGREAWRGCHCLWELKRALDGYPFYWTPGNHDPYPWVVELLGDWPNVHIARSMVWDTPVGLVEFRHGHRWAVDWWILRHIAPPLVEILTELCPNQWYWICQQMGWLLSERRREIENMATSTPEKERDYQQAIECNWWMATGHTHRKRRRVVLGHTHADGGLVAEGEVLVADGGTLKDREFIRIDREMGIDWCTL